jgi:ATP-dependent DNA ligase
MHYVTRLGIWLKVKCLYREEFVVVGWTDPRGRRPYLGALLQRRARLELRQTTAGCQLT